MFIVLHLGQPCSSLMERLAVVQAIFVGEQLMVSEFAPAEEEERQRGAVERLALFTDAVVAIVTTLMVLEVKPPHIRAEGELLPALRGLWHEYLAVAISFLVIELFWTRHHALFQWVKRHDARLVWINLLFLMSISCIPFVTAVLAQHGQTAATVLYAATVGVSSLLAGWLWQHVGSSQGLAPALPDNTRRVTVLASIATAGVFALSIPFAFFSPTAAKLVWLAIIPIALTRRYRLAHA